MPVIPPSVNKRVGNGALGLYEHSYHIISAEDVHQLSILVDDILKRNVNDNGYRIFTVIGGPVYDARKEQWHQALVGNRWLD